VQGRFGLISRADEFATQRGCRSERAAGGTCWRIVRIACAELFGYGRGEEWLIPARVTPHQLSTEYRCAGADQVLLNSSRCLARRAVQKSSGTVVLPLTRGHLVTHILRCIDGVTRIRRWHGNAARSSISRFRSPEDTPARTPLTPALAKAPPAMVISHSGRFTTSEPNVEVRTWLPARILASEKRTQPRIAPGPARRRLSLLRGFFPPSGFA